jgi:hypothetical protein
MRKAFFSISYTEVLMSQDHPSPKKATALDPEREQALKNLVDILTRPDEARHRAAVAWVQSIHPTVRNLVVERLIRVVRAGAETARPAETSLEELGEVAIPILCDELVSKPRTAAASQVRLIRLLGRMSLKLPLRKQILIMAALRIVENRTRHKADADAANWASWGLDELADSTGDGIDLPSETWRAPGVTISAE